MSTVNVRHCNRWSCPEILAYFSNTKPLIKEINPIIWWPVFLQSLWPWTQYRTDSHRMSRVRMFSSKEVNVVGVNVRWSDRRFALERVPLHAQCSTYTTHTLMDDVSRLACLCLCSTLLSVSRRANRRAVSHKYFQSPLWKRVVMGNDVRYSTPASVGQTKPRRNSTTQSRMCTGKDTRGYLSARSSTRKTDFYWSRDSQPAMYVSWRT